MAEITKTIETARQDTMPAHWQNTGSASGDDVPVNADELYHNVSDCAQPGSRLNRDCVAEYGEAPSYQGRALQNTVNAFALTRTSSDDLENDGIADDDDKDKKKGSGSRTNTTNNNTSNTNTPQTKVIIVHVYEDGRTKSEHEGLGGSGAAGESAGGGGEADAAGAAGTDGADAAGAEGPAGRE